LSALPQLQEAYDPLISEFENAEQEAAYTTWLQEKVKRSLADPHPPIPHEEVMAEMDALIAQIAAKQRH
jgi:hypothetical protein